MYRSTIHFKLIFVSGITFSTPLHDYSVILVASLKKIPFQLFWHIYQKSMKSQRDSKAFPLHPAMGSIPSTAYGPPSQ